MNDPNKKTSWRYQIKLAHKFLTISLIPLLPDDNFPSWHASCLVRQQEGLPMESLIPSVVNRKWFLCSLASFFGLLFVSFSLNKASSRPGPALASFRDSETSVGATLLESGVPLSSQTIQNGGPIRGTQTVDMVRPPTTTIALSPLSSYVGSSPQTSAKELVSPTKKSSGGVPVISSESNGTNLVSSQSKMEMRRYKENTSLLVSVGGGAEKEKVKEEKKCDIFDGKWVYDRKGYPLYRGHWCPFLSDQVSCQKNGRPDKDYEHWRWQPRGCEIPRYLAFKTSATKLNFSNFHRSMVSFL